MDVCGLVLLLFCSVALGLYVNASAKRGGTSFLVEVKRILKDFHNSANDEIIEIDTSRKSPRKQVATSHFFKDSNIA